MGRAKNQKLGRRLLAVVISVLATIAVMAVGVYASTANFSLQVENKVNISISKVDGTLSARRSGDVIYGAVSLGDDGVDSDGHGPVLADTQSIISGRDANGYYHFYPGTDQSTYNKVVADSEKYLVIYDQIDEVNDTNLNEIQQSVNFYLSAKDSEDEPKDKLTIYYVFKFDFLASSPQDVKITLTDSSTKLGDNRKDKVTIEYKYMQGVSGTAEPSDWSSATNVLSGNATSGIIDVKSGDSADQLKTHTTYIYAAMTVERTNTLKTAYTLGLNGDVFHWAFTLSFEPV